MMKSIMVKSNVIFFLSLFGVNAFAAGALAIDKKQGEKYGWAIDYQTFEEAETRALEECGENCSIVLRFSGGAAAYAADQAAGSTVYGWGRADNAEQAKTAALEQAKKLGATKPIVRAWGEESKKDSALNEIIGDSKVKVFLYMKLSLNEKHDKTGWASFTGWTYASKSELNKYSLDKQLLIYSDEIKGKNITPYFLKTALPNAGAGDSETSPIMKEFVQKYVETHPIYASRSMSKYVNGAMTMRSTRATKSSPKAKYFGYDAKLIIMDGQMTYDELKKATQFFERKKGGYSLIDIGEF
jgi:hypothetical protein